MDLIDQVGAHEQVVEEELGWSAPVCTDSSYGCRKVDYGIRTSGLEQRLGFVGICEIAIGAPHELWESPFRFKRLADMAAQEPCSSGDQYACPIKFHE